MVDDGEKTKEKIPEIEIEPAPDWRRLIGGIILILPFALLKYHIVYFPIGIAIAYVIFRKINSGEKSLEYREWRSGKMEGKITIMQYYKGVKQYAIKIPDVYMGPFQGVKYADENIILVSGKSTKNGGRILVEFDPDKIRVEHNLPCGVELEDGVLRIDCDDVSIRKSIGFVDENIVFTEADFDEYKETAENGVFLQTEINDNVVRILPPSKLIIVFPGPHIVPHGYWKHIADEYELDDIWGVGEYRIRVADREYTLNIFYDE